MRVLIIGGSHAGIATARHLKKINPTTEVILIEQSNVLGYIGSSLNLFMEKYVAQLEDCRTTNASELMADGINVMLQAKVTKIDNKKKMLYLTLKDGKTSVTDQLKYDYLVLAMGSSQYNTTFSPEGQALLTNFKSLPQAKEAVGILRESEKIVIIGAGLIGFELAETLSQLNKKVVLLDRMNQALFRYFDKEILSIFLPHIPKNVELKLNSNVEQIQFDKTNKFKGVYLSDNEFIQGDAIVYAINPRPNIDLVKDFLEINRDGTIYTNEFLQTSDEAIYAVGDLVSVFFNQQESMSYIPLVTNAYRTGIIAATNILLEEKRRLPVVQRTVASHLFDFYVASAGMNEEEAPYYGLDVASVTKTYTQSALFGKENDFEMTLKFVFEQETGHLVGGQLISNHEKSLELINTLSALITSHVTLDTILTMDFYFNPKFSNPVHFFNDLALEGILIK